MVYRVGTHVWEVSFGTRVLLVPDPVVSEILNDILMETRCLMHYLGMTCYGSSVAFSDP